MNQPEPNKQANPQNTSADPAVGLIRSKIDRLYEQEPETEAEMLEAYEAGSHRSKHQAFMYKLSTSGKSLAEIQTAWHNYYINLPDTEKHEVWQEFYEAHDTQQTAKQQPPTTHDEPAHHVASTSTTKKSKTAHRKPRATSDTRSVADVKEQLLRKVNKRTKTSTKHNLQALAFGLGMGGLVLVIMLFGFFNERFIAPFITPSKNVSNTSIIIDPNDTTASADPRVIIPKINVEIPVIYGSGVDESSIQKDLESGVAHYSTTPSPGELGNSVIFGHSSNNIFNKGQYKFAFVLLNRLENGDTFSLTKNSKRYTYRVYEKKIVTPSDLSVLATHDKKATATLITCDPPGTSLNRLIVVGEQISPDPNANSVSTAVASTTTPSVIPSNSITLWQRFKNWLFN